MPIDLPTLMAALVLGGGRGNGSGLPDASELSDGTALISVDGGWKMQDGYGYNIEPTIITFNGDLAGKDAVDLEEGIKLVRVSDTIPSLAELQGVESIFYSSTVGNVEQTPICSEEDGLIVGRGNVDGNSLNMFFVIPDGYTLETETSLQGGIYILYYSTESDAESYTTQLTFGGENVPFDTTLIPEIVAGKVMLSESTSVYFSSNNVDGVLQEIGASLNGVEEVLYSINNGLEGLL